MGLIRLMLVVAAAVGLLERLRSLVGLNRLLRIAAAVDFLVGETERFLGAPRSWCPNDFVSLSVGAGTGTSLSFECDEDASSSCFGSYLTFRIGLLERLVTPFGLLERLAVLLVPLERTEESTRSWGVSSVG